MRSALKMSVNPLFLPEIELPQQKATPQFHTEDKNLIQIDKKNTILNPIRKKLIVS